jgi:DNA-binding XRE family transcriptional regulator
MNLSDMVPLDDLVEQHRRDDPEFRRLWDASEFAQQVAIAVVRYRAEHDLTQQQLAELLGVHQPNIARLECGEKPPTLKELARITAATGLTFHLSVAGGTVALAEAA